LINPNQKAYIENHVVNTDTHTKAVNEASNKVNMAEPIVQT